MRGTCSLSSLRALSTEHEASTCWSSCSPAGAELSFPELLSGRLSSLALSVRKLHGSRRQCASPVSARRIHVSEKEADCPAKERGESMEMVCTRGFCKRRESHSLLCPGAAARAGPAAEALPISTLSRAQNIFKHPVKLCSERNVLL